MRGRRSHLRKCLSLGRTRTPPHSYLASKQQEHRYRDYRVHDQRNDSAHNMPNKWRDNGCDSQQRLITHCRPHAVEQGFGATRSTHCLDRAIELVQEFNCNRCRWGYRVLVAYNFLLVIFFTAVGPPVASLPTFFGAIAGFTTTAAALVSWTSRGE